MPFFDFHLHPSLKAQFSAPAGRPGPWERVRLRFRNPDLLIRILQCEGINEVVDSQASLDQLVAADLNLAAIALHPPESAMMRDGLIQKIAEEEQTRYIDNARVDAIGTGDIYYSLLLEELDNLQRHISHSGRQLMLLRSLSEYNPADRNTVYAVLTVEGAHAFHGHRSGQSAAAIRRRFRDNFRDFTETRGVRLFSLNIAHLQENEFCNHAFGIQLFKPEPFFPKGKGLTEDGLWLLGEMKRLGIFCDVKHMSLFARQQLYGLGWQGGDWPLVCTHAGLTGIHSADRGRYFLSHRRFGDGFLRVKQYKPAGYLKGCSFNASSINLYDDDVVTIVHSGGLIGLSLDQRILGVPDESMLAPGYTDEVYEQEIISPEERDFFREVNRNTVPDEAVLKPEDIRRKDRQDYPDYHARHFLNQVFHLFRIARRYGIDDAVISRRICIGSDFDGMINPVDGCRTVEDLPGFTARLLTLFPEAEQEFFRKSGFRVSDILAPGELLERIFFRNGHEFLQQWYT